jgi:hypothetical protein
MNISGGYGYFDLNELSSCPHNFDFKDMMLHESYEYFGFK